MALGWTFPRARNSTKLSFFFFEGHKITRGGVFFCWKSSRWNFFNWGKWRSFDFGVENCGVGKTHTCTCFYMVYRDTRKQNWQTSIAILTSDNWSKHEKKYLNTDSTNASICSRFRVWERFIYREMNWKDVSLQNYIYSCCCSHIRCDYCIFWTYGSEFILRIVLKVLKLLSIEFIQCSFGKAWQMIRIERNLF